MTIAIDIPSVMHLVFNRNNDPFHAVRHSEAQIKWDKIAAEKVTAIKLNFSIRAALYCLLKFLMLME